MNGQLQRIGWVGWGNMGSRMAPRLMAAGHHLIVHDRSELRNESARAAGATIASSLAELAASCSVVVTMLPDEDSLRQVILQPEGLAEAMAAGTILIDASTVSPAMSADMARVLDARGIPYLRAPVSGSTVAASKGQLTFFVSGAAETFERCAGLLGHLGHKVLYTGPGEEARVTKLMVNVMVCITNAALAEALSFGRRQGLAWTAMVDAIAGSAVSSPYVQSKADALRRRDWTAAAPIALIGKDAGLALSAGRDAAAPMPLTAAAKAQLDLMEQLGHGGLDMASVVLAYETDLRRSME